MVRAANGSKAKSGFTLIELLIVIAIIGILAAIVLVAVDPAKRLAQSRDARRSGEVYSVLNAILNYTVDNKGVLPSTLLTSTSNTPYMLGTAPSACDGAACNDISTASACLNLSGALVDTYIAAMPVDPRGSAVIGGYVYAASSTGYYVEKTPSGRILVGSCQHERTDAPISVER